MTKEESREIGHQAAHNDQFHWYGGNELSLYQRMHRSMNYNIISIRMSVTINGKELERTNEIYKF